MADHEPLQSPTSKPLKSISSYFFNSANLFTGFSLKSLFDSDSTVTSPTSILDNKSFKSFRKYTSFCDTIKINSETEHTKYRENFDSKCVGLGIVDSLIDDEKNLSKSKSKTMVLFGSQLKIQIPLMPNSVFYPIESPKLPPDFGTKTRNSKLGFPPHGLSQTGSRSVFETEESNVLFSQLPNSRKSRDIENCGVERCCGAVGSPSYPFENFLSVCFNCNKKLGHGKDIYMYRGEKAFCSIECRYEEMMLEEKFQKYDGF